MPRALANSKSFTARLPMQVGAALILLNLLKKVELTTVAELRYNSYQSTSLLPHSSTVPAPANKSLAAKVRREVYDGSAHF